MTGYMELNYSVFHIILNRVEQGSLVLIHRNSFP
jgi:hypothetical protein